VAEILVSRFNRGNCSVL